jgi:hypothetical protein
MRARHRHFKPSSVAATVAYDARYIDLADDTGVETWADRSGNGRDLSQASSGKRPKFKAAVQGGCGAVRFDGSDDALASASYSVSNTTTGLLVYQSTQNSGGMIFERSTNFNNVAFTYLCSVENNTTNAWSNRSGNAQGVTNGYLAGNFTTRSTSWAIAQFNYFNTTDSLTFIQNGTALSRTLIGGAPVNSTGTANQALFVGARNQASAYYNGDIGLLYTINADVGDTMRKRLNHHAAYSFKIACS